MSLKLFLNLLVYHQNIFRYCLKVFGNLQESSENIQQHLCDLQTSFVECSENRQQFGCQYMYVYIIKSQRDCIMKGTLHVRSKILISCSRDKNNTSLIPCGLFLPLEHKIHIFLPSAQCDILYVYRGNFTSVTFIILCEGLMASNQPSPVYNKLTRHMGPRSN